MEDCEDEKELYDCGRGLGLKYDDDFKWMENKDFYHEVCVTQKNGRRIENTMQWTLSYIQTAGTVKSVLTLFMTL